MHYLDDCLELLDPLPEIMREKLTMMRESDLKIQADFDQLEENASKFLSSYRHYQSQQSSPQRTRIQIKRQNSDKEEVENIPGNVEQQKNQLEYDKLVEKYQQLIQQATTKVPLANESHDIIERYYKKLEHDLNKFKMELEADYSGITETLEKRVNEGFNENENTNNIYDRRGLLHADFYNSILGSNEFNLDPLFEIFEDFTDEYSNIGTLTHTYSPYPLTQASRPSAGASSTRKYFRQSITFPSTSTRGRKRLHGTSTPTKRKRNSTTRTPSTNINNFYLTDSSHLILPSSDSDESSSSYLQSALSTTQDYFNTNSNSIEHQQHQLSFEDDFDQAANILTANYSGSSGQVDDRRYCFCNQMSYGEMIACDNPLCTREWFHYRCVNIQVAPKGKWYCSECLKQTAAITSQLSASTNKQTSISSSSQNTLSPPLA